MITKHPLEWPDGWPRTRLQDREERKGWKKTELQSIKVLDIELHRFGAVAPIITRKDPEDFRTAPDPPSPSLAPDTKSEDYGFCDNCLKTFAQGETYVQCEITTILPDKTIHIPEAILCKDCIQAILKK